MNVSVVDSLGTNGYTGVVKPTPEELERARHSLESDLGSRYRLREYLGRGTFATVWLAGDVAAREDVAVKRFNAQGDRPRDFYRELSVLFRLRHPSLVRIINLLETANGSRYLILEYCAGGSLRAALSRAYRNSLRCAPERATALALQLAEGLALAHREGIVHRDVKPENILFAGKSLGDFGGTSAVKLADFGLARLFQQNQLHDSLQRLSGSPAYMAPEQFQGEFGPASDLYSLGVVLYELLLSRLPFVGSTEELAYQHLQTSPATDALPGPWRRWLPRLLAKNPSERPQLSEWIAELRGANPPQRSSTMTQTPVHLQHALDRDLDRLQSTLAALGSLKRGQRPQMGTPSLLRRNGVSLEVAHPGMDGAISWEPEDAAAVAAPAPFPGLTESSPVFVPTAALAQEDAQFPEEAAPSGSSNPWSDESEGRGDWMEGAGKSVDSVLSGFDWR